MSKVLDLVILHDKYQHSASVTGRFVADRMVESSSLFGQNWIEEIDPILLGTAILAFDVYRNRVPPVAYEQVVELVEFKE